MEFGFSNEQHQFRAALKRFLDDHSSPAQVRRAMVSDQGFDRTVWRTACEDLGVAGIRIPEHYGGAGFGYVELGIALEEMGRALCCAPFFSSTVMAVEVLLAAGVEQYRELLLPSIASGRAIATVAIAEAGGDWDPATVTMTADTSAAGVILSGSKHFVPDGSAADVILVVAREPDSAGLEGLALYLADADSDGLTREDLTMLDPTRRMARLGFDHVRAERISEPGGAGLALSRALDHAAIALANEMVGGCQVLLDAVVEYAKLRMQFGRVIGSFQAIKHKCADMLLDVEHAKSAAYRAAASIDANDPQVTQFASLAKATASDAYMRTAAEAIQIHGGIGFTWDHDTHLWFKRAKSSQVFLGSPDWHRERYLQAVEIEAVA